MTGSFPAFDQAGNQYTVCVSQDFHDTSSFEGSGEIGGITYLTLGNIAGQSLNRIGQGNYVVLHTGLKLVSSDPKAV